MYQCYVAVRQHYQLFITISATGSQEPKCGETYIKPNTKTISISTNANNIRNSYNNYIKLGLDHFISMSITDI